jgi:hypothetical protein
VDAPLRSVEFARATEWEDGQSRSISDDLEAEEPLRILACSELARELKKERQKAKLQQRGTKTKLQQKGTKTKL